MKKMKKILAMLLALTMVLGMSLTSMAAEVPSEDDATKVEVSNVEVSTEEKEMTVTAYQIVYGDYDSNGFVKYLSVKDGENALVADPLSPTAEEVFEIAQRISTNQLTSLKPVTMSDNYKDKDGNADPIDGTYAADLNAGYWVVLVTGGMEVYNPMLVSAYYYVSGSDNTLTAGNVSADDAWSIEGQGAVAKSDDTLLTKSVNGATWNLGDIASYVVTALVPQYSDSYVANDIEYKIVDAVQNGELKIDIDSIKVYTDFVGDDNVVAASNYSLDASEIGYTIDFNGDWVQKNANKVVMITYEAEVANPGKVEQDGVYAKDAHDNIVTLTYTNAPNTVKVLEAKESVYTFEIEGLIEKVYVNEKDKKVALPGAEFTLYTDEECKTKYKNSNYPKGCTIKSEDDGSLNIYGLKENIYYLKETKAPTGYSLNDTVYKIVIKATTNDPSTTEGYMLSGWTVSVTDTALNSTVTATYTVAPAESDADKTVTVTYTKDGKATEAGVTQIINTALVKLPSTGGIGTTIFTVAGCGIMIAAAYFFFASRKKES